MTLLVPGTELDGFVVEECIHSGEMAHVYRVRYADSYRSPGFDMVVKVPHVAVGCGGNALVSFEVECQTMQALQGPHVPRFVAAGGVDRVPYMVMEYINGHTLAHRLNAEPRQDVRDIARLGVAMARAAHTVHQQNAVHLNLNPANVLFRPDGSAVLLDFGLSCHAHFPDLLAEQLRKAVGSPAWIAPEQVLGVRGDPRSDLFAIGVMLYQLVTRELPFGEPQTAAGLRQRLWRAPQPPRKHQPLAPEWLQEVILRCLEPEANRRYPSGAHLAFDLMHPAHVTITTRGRNTTGTSFGTHFKRWVKAVGMRYQPSPLPAQQIEEVPIVMVAVPHKDASNAVLHALRQAVARAVGTRPGAHLACVSVIPPCQNSASDSTKSESSVQRRCISTLRQWAQPLEIPGHQTSYHVLESGDVAQALLLYAAGNCVSVIVMGAATQALKAPQCVSTVSIKVAMDAPCTVILVKQALPFAHLGAAGRDHGAVDVAAPKVDTDGAHPPLLANDLGPLR